MMQNRFEFLKKILPWSMLLVFLSVSAPGCGGGASRQYAVRPIPEIARYNRIAVFPFENLSGIPEASGRVTHMMISELHGSNTADVVDPGEIQEFILRSRLRFPSQLDLATIREASRQLDADGVIFGCVNEYAVVTTDLGPLPAVSVTVRLVDAGSGEIVWSSTRSLQGDYKEKFFGMGRVNSIGTLAEILVREMIDGLRLAMAPGSSNGTTGVASFPPTNGPATPAHIDLRIKESERQKAHTDVLQEWDSIKKLSN